MSRYLEITVFDTMYVSKAENHVHLCLSQDSKIQLYLEEANGLQTKMASPSKKCGR